MEVQTQFETDPILPVKRRRRVHAIPAASFEATHFCVNGRLKDTKLTICIPCYQDSPLSLLKVLTVLPGAASCSVLIYDDGTCSSELTTRLQRAIRKYPGPATLITCKRNKGRSVARNRLTKAADTDWLLLLDADMLPDRDDFLSGYLEVLSNHRQPALISGGYSIKQIPFNPLLKLHMAQASKSNCLSAAQRSRQPGRYVFTSNILVHRSVLSEVPFDESFNGWGWEDVDWGLRVVRRFPVLHLDHTATHMGLDCPDALLEKYGSSGANFARVVQRHPDAAQKMALVRVINYLHWLPPVRLPFVRRLLRGMSRRAALSSLPMRLRLMGLKSFRALHYYEHIR